jgi:Asp-tRNA(Asn)/Glu-tRNA(Gln) amidotransferase A subunit family amidase
VPRAYGAIDLTGILEGEQPPDDTIRWLSHAGITTRSVKDTALVLDVLAEQHGDAKADSWRDALGACESIAHWRGQQFQGR